MICISIRRLSLIRILTAITKEVETEKKTPQQVLKGNKRKQENIMITFTLKMLKVTLEEQCLGSMTIKDSSTSIRTDDKEGVTNKSEFKNSDSLEHP